MFDPNTLHADLVAYCQRNGIRPSSFGQYVIRDAAFAASLSRGSVMLNKLALAHRFMAENPDVPRRQFGAVAKAWRERVAAENGTGGSGGDHAPNQAAAAGDGSITDATLDQVISLHNQESQSGVA